MFKNKKIIAVISVLIPVVVALLAGIKQKIDLGAWTKVLPHLIGIINTLTSIVLVAAFLAIKQGKKVTHEKLMWIAFCLGGIFLPCYVLYHITNPPTPFGGTGFVKIMYYFFLVTHILLSIIVVRLVLMAIHYAVTSQFEQHRSIVKVAFPIWLYVSVTGVIVYLMIKSYY